MANCTYAEILDRFEQEPSEVVYTIKLGGAFSNSEDWVEKSDPGNRKYNLMSQQLSWIFERRDLTKGWSRKKKCKINNRLLRFFRNVKKRVG